MIYRKLQVTLIYIRSQCLDTHCLTFVHQLRDVRDVRQASAHYSRHIFRWVVCFQISCLISDPWVTSSVWLIESVRRKLFPVRPNLFKYFRVVSILTSSFNKFRFHVIQLVTQLLTHCFTKGVGLTTGKVCQQTWQKHHLFLIYRDSVGIFQVFLHNRNIILDRLASMLAVDKIRNIIHRSRTVQSIHGYQILKSRRL